MRTLTDHIVPGDSPSHQLTISVMDDPGPGGACHQYMIHWKDTKQDVNSHYFVGFQKGPIAENGINGVDEASLLAIVIDRLKSSPDRSIALSHCKAAIDIIKGEKKS